MSGERPSAGAGHSPSRPRILLVEDDPSLGVVIQDLLELKGFAPVLVRDGEAALEAFESHPPDLCLVDVMLPKLDGFAFARAVRGADRHVPIIFLTAKAMKEDRVEGFTIGGDDYVTKPFHAEELMLRIEAVLRRTTGRPAAVAEGASLAIGRYRFDPDTRRLEGETGCRTLTQKETDLLHLLVRHRNRVLERGPAMRAVWGREDYFVSRSMDVYISRLRRHLAADPQVEIQNVHGRGFRLRTPSSAGDHPTTPASPEPAG